MALLPRSGPLCNKVTAYGYARVSTLDQDLTAQQQALRAASCRVIRAETASGSRRDGRTELQVLLDFVQPGDSLVVTRIDRLVRSVRDLQDIVHELKGCNLALRATEQPVDTSTAAGKAFLDMLGVFAEFETNLRRAASASSRASRSPRRAGCVAVASRASRRRRSGGCATRTGSARPPSPGGSASPGPRSTRRSGHHELGGRRGGGRGAGDAPQAAGRAA